MSSDYVNVNTLAARWWVLIVRGVAAILFGVLAIAMPELSLLALVLLWGVYALVDGASNLVLAARGARAGRSWGWPLFEGIAGIAAGVIAFAWPGITAMVLLVVIALWAMVTGIAKIAAAVALRRELTGEWLLATSGVFSIIFGVLVLLFPGSGALALVWIIGAYAIVFGALLIGLGVRLNRWRQGGQGQGGQPSIPVRGTPTAP